MRPVTGHARAVAWPDGDRIAVDGDGELTAQHVDELARAGGVRFAAVLFAGLHAPAPQLYSGGDRDAGEQGAGAAVHSATKAIGGHSDLLLGLTVTADAGLAGQLTAERMRSGATPGVLEAWLALRGLRTLPVRLAEATRTAGFLAGMLAAHPAVTRVRYPGHPSYPQAALARVQMRGGGTVLAFELAGGHAADRVCHAVRLVRHATSLGGVETTMKRRQRLAGDAHVPAGLIRLSVGLEDPGDLWDDLEQALGHAQRD